MSDSTTVDTPEVDTPEVNAPEVNAPEVNAPPKHKPTPSDTKPKPLPPYAVVVLDDEDHTFPYVIEALQRVCGHKLEAAWLLTEQIHVSGRAVVWSGSKEVAELKRDQIRGFGPDFHAEMTVRYPLGVVLEPLPDI